MAGLKNMYQQYGATPFEPITGGSIYDRDMKLKTREYTPYCQFCGGEIINADTNEYGHKVDPVWERENQAHYRCVLQQRPRHQ